MSISNKEINTVILYFLQYESKKGIYSSEYINGVITVLSAYAKAVEKGELFPTWTSPFSFNAFLKYSTIYPLLPADVINIFIAIFLLDFLHHIHISVFIIFYYFFKSIFFIKLYCFIIFFQHFQTYICHLFFFGNQLTFF